MNASMTRSSVNPSMNHRLLLSCALVLGVAASACEGRDPAIANLAPGPVDEPEPVEPTTGRRTLASQKLFGTLPVENRVEDPLMTLTGTGWFAFANSFRTYPTVMRRVNASPTSTPFLTVPGRENVDGGGATVLGQVKTARVPMHLEIWIGRDGVDTATGDVEVALSGLFASGAEESVDLVRDDASQVVIDNRTWVRFTVDVDEGPIGWAYLIAADASAEPTTLHIGGAAVVTLGVQGNVAQANAALVRPSKRALTVKERAMVDAVREKTRQLAPPPAPRPAPMPGVPPVR